MKKIMNFIYSLEPSWFRNNGWLNESIAGFAGTLIVMFATSGNIWASVILFSSRGSVGHIALIVGCLILRILLSLP